MKLTVQTAVIDHGMVAFKKRMRLMAQRKSYVKAGVLGDKHQREHTKGKTPSNAQLAAIAEYGLSNAPARPWVGPPFRLHRAEYLAMLRKAYERSLKSKDGGDAEFYRVLALIGQKMAADIKNYVTAGTSPLAPNAPSTIKAKGSSRPLVDTNQMVRSVDYEVVGAPDGGHKAGGAGGHKGGHH